MCECEYVMFRWFIDGGPLSEVISGHREDDLHTLGTYYQGNVRVFFFLTSSIVTLTIVFFSVVCGLDICFVQCGFHGYHSLINCGMFDCLLAIYTTHQYQCLSNNR